MKKKILLVAGCMTLCAVAVLGVKVAEQIKTSSLLMENIEALTDNESGTGTCAMYAWIGDTWATLCNVSKEEALDEYNWWSTPDKAWCCDSCSSSSWWANICTSGQ